MSFYGKMKESGSTILVITHRTSILTLVDKILLMKEGVVTNFGARDAVLREITPDKSKVTKLPSKG